MSVTVRAWLGCLLLSLCLLWLSACRTTSWFGGDWSGRYEFGGDHLQLLPSGEFHYKGDSCFIGGSDVGLPNEFAGRYRVEGRWIQLEPLNGGPIEGCGGVGLKLYALRADGHGYLMDDRYLRGLVNETRNGRTHDAFPTWHLGGAPVAFTAALSDWLPSPYAQWLKQPAPTGQVVAIGPVATQTLYGSAGRIDGQEHSAALTLDFGEREGAFDGMVVCIPGGTNRMLVRQVGPHQATLRWVWNANGGTPPVAGMKVTGYCPQTYAP